MLFRAQLSLIFLCLLAGTLAPPARADGGPGSSGAEFLTIGVGARPAGLAEAYSGLADDVHALAYNPAGLAFLQRRELGLDHNSYATGVNHEWLGYAHPTRWGTFGGAANLLFVAPFQSYDSLDAPSGKTSAADAAYQFSFATTLTQTMAVGLTAKHVSSRLHQTTARTFAGDAGVLWKPFSGLRLGGSVLNLGPGLRHIAATEYLPTTVRGGAAWRPFDRGDFRHSLTLAFDAEKRRDESARFGGGLEACYDGLLAIRLGGRSRPAAGTGLTLGMGIYLFRDETKGYEIDFDYAYTAAGDFATSHRAGLVLKFGEPITSAARAAVHQKAAVYFEDAARPKKRRDQAPPAPPVQRPRPSAEPAAIPDDFQWVTP